MQIAAPDLLKSGFFGIVAPPYYEVWVGKKKSSSTYVRDKKDLVQWKAVNLYDRELSIDIVYHYHQKETSTRLTTEQVVLLATVAFDVGMAIENLANEFSLPGLLIEALTRATYYLTPQTMNVTAVQEILGAHRVEYNAAINTLIVSLGREDYVIPLFHVQDRICGQVSTLLRKLQWRDWDIVVSSRHNPTMQNVPMSLYQLYEVFKHADRLITVKVLKGIGSMDSSEAARACMDVRNRRVYTITDPGNVDVIFDLMGDDPQARKDLMAAPPLTDYRRVLL